MSPAKPSFPSALGPLAAALAASLAGAILMAPRASAADLDPGYADVPPPITQQMVTFGSGWYVRGDIAATDDSYKLGIAQSKTQADLVGLQLSRSQDAAYDFSLGGGYAFTNQFRADIVVDFNRQYETHILDQPCIGNTKSATCTDEGRFARYDALINGYYDIGTWSIVTPYVGVGVGVGFGGVNIGQSGGSGGYYTGYAGYQNFAWALMAGLALDVYPHVKLDVGYRYVNDGSIYGLKLYNNEIRAGLRYMIDN